MDHISNIYFWGKINHWQLCKTCAEKAHVFRDASGPGRASTLLATEHKDPSIFLSCCCCDLRPQTVVAKNHKLITYGSGNGSLNPDLE